VTVLRSAAIPSHRFLKAWQHSDALLIADANVMLRWRPILLRRPMPAAKGLSRIDGDTDAILIADPQADQSRRVPLVRRTPPPPEGFARARLAADPVLVPQAARVLRDGQPLLSRPLITVERQTLVFLDPKAEMVTAAHQPLADRLTSLGRPLPRRETFLVGALE